LEAALWWLLPALGVHWFYDRWRVGGTLPLLGYVLLGAAYLEHRWPADRNG
jgi:hypothetical protein